MSEQTLTAHTKLWLGGGVVLGIWSILQGAAYVYEGNEQVVSPALYVLERIPGHMHTYGVVMVILGISFLFELKEHGRVARHLLSAFCGLTVLVSFTIFGSWWITDRVIFAAPWQWLAFAALSGLMIAYPPTLGAVHHNEDNTSTARVSEGSDEV